MKGIFKKTVCFEITGGCAERFLNIASRRWLNVFNVNHRDGKTFAFSTAREFPALCAVAEKTGCRLAIISRYGIPYYTEKYRDRWGFAVGFAVFLGLLYVLSLFVWSVDVENLPEECAVSVSDILYDEGIRVGVLCSSIDGKTLQMVWEDRLPEFDMVRVSRMGCWARVQLSTAVPVRKPLEGHEPCDLIAKESGQIVSATASKGTIFVKDGDIVVPGDVLISGVFDSLEESIVMVHATGEVRALVDKTFSEIVPYEQIVTEPTGHIVNINRLMAFGLEIPLFGSLPKGNYSRTYDEYPLRLLGFEFPLTIRREQWHELCYVKKQFTATECVEQAEKELSRQISKAEHIGIVSSERTVNETETGVRVTRYVTFLKDIAEERPLLVEPNPAGDSSE